MYSSLKYTQRLEAAGFSREQAEETVSLVLETMDHHFATKNDIRESEFALREDIRKSEQAIREDMVKSEQSIRSDMNKIEQSLRKDIQEIRHEMALMKSQLTITMGGIMMAGITILGTFQYFTR